MELSSLLLQPGSDWSVCDSGESPALPGSCSAPDRGPLGGPSPPFCSVVGAVLIHPLLLRLIRVGHTQHWCSSVLVLMYLLYVNRCESKVFHNTFMELHTFSSSKDTISIIASTQPHNQHICIYRNKNVFVSLLLVEETSCMHL